MTDTIYDAEVLRQICTTAAIVVASAVCEPEDLSWNDDAPTFVAVDRNWLVLLADEVEKAQPGYIDEIREGLERMDKAPTLTAGVYFIRAGEAIKIGMSRDVPGRLRALRTMSPLPLELLGVIPGARDEEAALHRQWAGLRLHGEWFTATPDLIGAVEGLCSAARLADRSDSGEEG